MSACCIAVISSDVDPAAFSNKILTSARNGELIMWDLNQSKLGEIVTVP